MRTIFSAVPVGVKHLAASGACSSAVPFDVGVSALPGTVFYNGVSLDCSAGVEGLFAMGALDNTAIMAGNHTGGIRHEVFTARPARLNWYDRRRQDASKVGIFGQEFLFGFAVTERAKCNQVVEAVRFPVVSEQAKWLDVVDVQIGRRVSAMLARILVALPGCTALRVPVGATIHDIAAKPSRIVLAGIVSRAPLTQAFSIAKVVFAYCVGLLLDCLTAPVARNRYSFTSPTGVVFGLPFSITRHAAEVPFRYAFHVWLGLIGLLALLAYECNHTSHYTLCKEN